MFGQLFFKNVLKVLIYIGFVSMAVTKVMKVIKLFDVKEVHK